MDPFKFTRAQSNSAAITEAATVSGSKFIAGGTNLIDLMKLDIETPKQLIDINNLDLKKVETLPNGGVMIGALVKNTTLAYHPLIQQRYPVLSQAILSGASAQLRNAATTAGNIMQRTRCPYFYDTAFPCNKRQPGSGCSSIPGFTRTNAVLGTSEYCIATHPSDMSVAMAALDAVIHVQGPHGNRSIPFANFHLLPGKTPHLEHNLKAGELITSVEIPALPAAVKSHYLKVRDRASYEFALTSAAVVLDAPGGTVRTARIALGGVATKPWRSVAAEQAMIGQPANEQTFRKAAEIALSGAKPYKENGFKIELSKRTIVRALTIAGGMA